MSGDLSVKAFFVNLASYIFGTPGARQHIGTGSDTHPAALKCVDHLQTYLAPTKKKYKTYSAAKAAFQGREAAPAPHAERLFALPELVLWLRELACSLEAGAGPRESAMLAGVLRARGLQSASRRARMSDGS